MQIDHVPDEYVLIVDDEPSVRELLRSQVEYLGHAVRLASDAGEALRLVREHPTLPLVLSDVHMPGVSGIELLRHLKQENESLQVVMVTGLHDLDTVRGCLREGAYDYLTKPVELDDLGRVVSRAIERCYLLRENERYKADLEHMVLAKTKELRQTRDIALMTLAKLAESRDNETGLHLDRMAAYTRRLGQELQSGPYAGVDDDGFVEQLHRSSPLHDIGKVGIPDTILLKPGPLTVDEFHVMQTHTTIGGDTLRSVIERYETHSFLVMAMEIAYSHHERWNGDGYPAGLSAEEIPLAARIVALTDAYDAITSDRPYKRSVPHERAVQRIQVDRGQHFDPVIVDAFLACQSDFPEIRRELEPAAESAPPAAGGAAAEQVVGLATDGSSE